MDNDRDLADGDGDAVISIRLGRGQSQDLLDRMPRCDSAVAVDSLSVERLGKAESCHNAPRASLRYPHRP